MEILTAVADTCFQQLCSHMTMAVITEEHDTHSEGEMLCVENNSLLVHAAEYWGQGASLSASQSSSPAAYYRHTYIHDKCIDEFNVVTHETEPTESLILLHSFMIRSQLGSPRPLVADTVIVRETKEIQFY